MPSLTPSLTPILTQPYPHYRGAVAQDGRIEPGDMILEVNGSLFENMSNDEAVKTLRDAVQQPGLTFVVYFMSIACLWHVYIMS